MKTVQEVLTSIARQNVPAEFEDRSKWGKTRQRWDGLKVMREGWRIKTKRRKKAVNHGTWQRYRVTLVDPQREFVINVENMHDAGGGRISFDVVFVAPMRAFGRLSKWVNGVQLFSISLNANVRVALRVRCRLAMQLDPSKLPPDVLLDPVVTDAQLHLVQFQVYRISDVGGSVAKEFGRALRRVLEDKIKQKRHKLVERINREIDKNRDKMRLSLHGVIASKWREVAEKYLPDELPPATGESSDRAATPTRGS